MGNAKTKNKTKKVVLIVTSIVVAVIILLIMVFVARKSALEKCADGGVIYIWGEQNKAYTNKKFKEKMNDQKNFKDFPYKKLYEICDESQKKKPKMFEEKWGK
jgi:lipopolysaccharide/colanic/teichoic acid biosynthesis glycosyltransferase